MGHGAVRCVNSPRAGERGRAAAPGPAENRENAIGQPLRPPETMAERWARRNGHSTRRHTSRGHPVGSGHGDGHALAPRPHTVATVCVDTVPGWPSLTDSEVKRKTLPAGAAMLGEGGRGHGERDGD